jgi:methionine-rich copper-binding protein CopC
MARTYRVAVAAVALTAAGVALLFAVSPSGPAMTAATPPDGAALAAAPAAVELAVSKRPDVGRSHVSVVDGSGVLVRAGALTADGADGLRLPVTITGRGTYTVAYHVELAGGGVLTGSWRFGIGAAPDGPPPPAGAPHGHGVDPVGAALLVVDGLVAVGAIVLLLRRRRVA